MRYKIAFLLSILCALWSQTAWPAANGLTADQIVAKHVAARGGLDAWRAVQALSLNGKIDAGRGDSVQRSAQFTQGGKSSKSARVAAATNGSKAQPNAQVQLPIMLALARPNKSRVEIQFAGKTAVQVYDGANGWKLRPYLNRNDVEPFTAEEAKSEAERVGPEGALVDYAAKGTKVELEGTEPVEGHNAYKMKLTMKNGDVQHVWIDAQSFLDVKVEGIPRRMDGKMHTVWVYQRDFRTVQGVKIPFVLETVVDGYPDMHKMVFEKAEVNPKFADDFFAKPRA